MVDVVDVFLKRVQAKAHLNIFLETFDAELRIQAEAQDKLSKAQKAVLPLLGLVLAIKDNIAYKGHTMSAMLFLS